MAMKRFALFGDLNRAELERVSELFAERRFRRGERIPARGQGPVGVVLLVEGRLRVVATTRNGRELTTRRYCAGSVAGLESLLPEREQRRDLETIAESDGQLAHAPVPEVVALMSHSPQLSRVLLLEAVRQMDDAEEFARRSLSSTVVGRVAAALLELDLPAEGAPVLREYLASLAAASRESVSRALHRLAAERVVELTGGGIRITDRAGLRRLATPRNAIPCYEGRSRETRVSICRDDYPLVVPVAE
jgi:CRP-like cAMP-binding protein